MRSVSIDALRGIAILGILFMNIPFHANMQLGYVSFDPMVTGDKWITLLYSVFADGRFRTLFCILFGAGLAIQYESCKRKEIDSVMFLKSRLNWLLLFGVVHGVFIFGGDVLMLYSVAGLILIKGLSLDTDILLKKSRKFLIIGSTLMLLIGVLMLAFEDPSERIIRGSEEHLASIQLWQGNYWYQTMVHAGFSILVLLTSPLSILWQVLGLMYLGSYLYRINFFTQGFSPSILKIIIVIGVISTLLCIAPQVFIDNISLEVMPLFSSVSAIFVALVYAHIVEIMCQSKSAFINMLTATGKVAFSLYILQSIVMGFILRWWLPEFSITTMYFDYFLLALACTVIQIVIANLYLRRYDQGPLEKIWRTLYNRSIEKKLKAQLER